MNETLQKYAEKLLAKLDQGWDLLEGELPLFVGEVLTYYRWTYAALVALEVAFIVLAIVFIRKALNADWEKIDALKYDAQAPVVARLLVPAIAFGICGFVSFMSLFVVEGHVFLLIKVWLAPRLFLIEWLKDFV